MQKNPQKSEKSDRVPYKDTFIHYTLVYTKRKKTIGIKIIGRHAVVVHSPRGLSRSRVESLIKKKGEWILRHSARENFLEEGILYLGAPLKLMHVTERSHGAPQRAYVKGNALFISGSAGNPRESIIAFLKSEAHKIVEERVRLFSVKMDVRPLKVLIKNNRSIWGSCTSKKTLNFSYRIVMAPLEIIDYVVVHELAHLVIMNHSRQFWELVARYVPEVQKKRKWLRENEIRLKL
jgi:predicted metal-dependent hydrolase